MTIAAEPANSLTSRQTQSQPRAKNPKNCTHNGAFPPPIFGSIE